MTGDRSSFLVFTVLNNYPFKELTMNITELIISPGPVVFDSGCIEDERPDL